MITRTLLAAALAAVTTSASAQLLVYEPFAYADAALNGNGGALGTTGTWATTDTLFAGGWWNHPGGSTTGQVWDDPDASTSNANGNQLTGDEKYNIFNGNYSNIPFAGGFAGSVAPGDAGLYANLDQGFGNQDGNIGLAPSVTASFTPGTTTWVSYVTARAWDRNEGTPQVLLSDTASAGGQRGLTFQAGATATNNHTTRSGNAIGGGGGPSRFNLQDIYPQYFKDGLNNHAPGGFDNPENPWNGLTPGNWTPSPLNAGTIGTNDGTQYYFGSGNDTTSRGQLDASQVIASARYTDPVTPNGFGDYNVVVMKIEWDADAGKDAISVVAFSSSDVITEAAFDAAILAKPDLSSRNWVGKNTLVNIGGIDYPVVYDDNKPDIDQSTLTILNISSLKFYIDEIRLANGAFSNLGISGPTFDPADLDQDGDVDDADFGIAFAAFTGPGGVSTSPADLDNDGDVDDADFGIAFAAFTGPGGPGVVPEPTSLALLGLGGLMIARRRRA